MAATEDGGLVSSSTVMSEDTLEWVPLSLTLVEYPQGDLIGKFLALASLTPFAIIAGFIALILFRRDLHTITFFAGTAVNELLNLILKHTICEARPMARSSLYTEYGMPSSHAQFMWFFTTYCTYFVLVRWVLPPLSGLRTKTRSISRLHHMNNSTPLESIWKLGVIFLCIASAVIVTISRVYLQYHTWRQVLGGAASGFIFASLWFGLTHIALTPLFPIVASWRISELLLLRDTSLIPNILWFEYTNSRQEARARGRKLVSMKSQ